MSAPQVAATLVVSIDARPPDWARTRTRAGTVVVPAPAIARAARPRDAAVERAARTVRSTSAVGTSRAAVALGFNAATMAPAVAVGARPRLARRPRRTRRARARRLRTVPTGQPRRRAASS